MRTAPVSIIVNARVSTDVQKCLAALFAPQSDYRIHARCTAGGNKTRQSRHPQQNNRYRANSRDIVGPEAVSRLVIDRAAIAARTRPIMSPASIKAKPRLPKESIFPPSPIFFANRP
jgi:hypothetical protein